MAPVDAGSKLIRTTGSATSCTLSTMIRPSGMECDFTASGDDLAFLESALRITGPESFQEDGTVSLGDECEHVLRFSTLSDGHITAGLEPGAMAGTSSWKIEGGRGQFAAARGFISSTFTVSDTGELSDYHCGLIFLPE